MSVYLSEAVCFSHSGEESARSQPPSPGGFKGETVQAGRVSVCSLAELITPPAVQEMAGRRGALSGFSEARLMLLKSKFWEERAAEAAAGRSSRGGRGLEAGEKMGLESLASFQHCPSLESQDTEGRSAEGDSPDFRFFSGHPAHPIW